MKTLASEHDDEREPSEGDDSVKEDKGKLIGADRYKGKGSLGLQLSLKKTKDGFDFSFNLYWFGAGVLIVLVVIQVL